MPSLPGMIGGQQWFAYGLLVLALLATACDVPIATDLDEQQANRTVVALQQHGVNASKQPGSTGADRFNVSVPRADASKALALAVEQRLLESPPPGLRGEPDDDVLVQSKDVERAELAGRVAGEIERTLLALDEILSARVHLALTPRLSSPDAPPSRASVLLRTKGPRVPLTETDVKTLVAGAVPGLHVEQVSVVVLGAPESSPTNVTKLTRIGPFSVAQDSAPLLRALALGLVGMNLLLLALLSALWWRWRKLRVLPSRLLQVESPQVTVDAGDAP